MGARWCNDPSSTRRPRAASIATATARRCSPQRMVRRHRFFVNALGSMRQIRQARAVQQDRKMWSVEETRELPKTIATGETRRNTPATPRQDERSDISPAPDSAGSRPYIRADPPRICIRRRHAAVPSLRRPCPAWRPSSTSSTPRSRAFLRQE